MLLPTNKEEMALRDWEYLDFLLISGDAYVDHSSFGTALIGRWLEHLGYRVGIIAQPDIESDDDFLRMGRPGMGIMLAAGNMDSMLSNYSMQGKARRRDDYSPGGRVGARPDYASLAYSRRAREIFGEKIPIIMGGVEASLRRFAHYDYWSDKVLPSFLYNSGADLLAYGMSELTVRDMAAVFSDRKAKDKLSLCTEIAGVSWICREREVLPSNVLLLPSYEEVSRDKKAFAAAFVAADREQNFFDGKPLAQAHGNVWIVNNRPSRPLTTEELDKIYELPYERRWHPSYDAQGGIPAFAEIKFSLQSHRGCFGGCSFCSLNFHQGRVIQSRSSESLLREAEILINLPDFKGYIHDVGGPTANFRGQVCKKAAGSGPCRDRQCLYPRICKLLPMDSSEYEKLLTDLRKLPKVKGVFIRSGLRFDYAMAEKSRSFLHTLCRYHISGQLKTAPEHVSSNVLKLMMKPPRTVYEGFVREYKEINRKQNKKQFLVPYFISSHPGCTLKDSVELAEYMRDHHVHPEQVQDFIPTPGSRSTCMYYTGLDPETMRGVYIPRSREEKLMQRALLQYSLPENKPMVIKALKKAGRDDLIGTAKKCLVQPENL